MSEKRSAAEAAPAEQPAMDAKKRRRAERDKARAEAFHAKRKRAEEAVQPAPSPPEAAAVRAPSGGGDPARAPGGGSDAGL